MRLYLSLARLSRKPLDVDPSPRSHSFRRGDQPRAVGRGRCRGAAAVPRYDGNDPRHRARRSGCGDRDRRRDVRRQHAPQPHLLAVRRGADHRGAVRLGRGARGTVPEFPDRRAGRAGARRDRVGDLDAHLLPRVRLHDHRRDCVDAPHRRAFPLGAPRLRRGVTGRRLHPFTLLAIAGALPALAWILPAPAGGACTAAVALVLTASRGLRRGLWPAVLTAAPFWVFLRLLHDVPTTIAIGLRITTMVASFVWLAATLAPDRLVEATVARGWSVTAAYLFAATITAVPMLRGRARRIVEAQRCRGLSPRGSLGNRLRALRALALPLVLSALHDVDERALALETRGMVSGARRTPLAPPPDSVVERAARWALLVACVRSEE